MKTYVYIITDTESKAFKIGLSANPEDRLKGLQTGNPHRLELSWVKEGKLKDERALQKRYASSRLEGEWFQSYSDGDELLVEGKAGNVACLIFDTDPKGTAIWKKKFNIRSDETDMCIVGFDIQGNPSW